MVQHENPLLHSRNRCRYLPPLLFIAFVICLKKKATQSNYANVYWLVLLTLTIVMIYCIILTYSSGEAYNLKRIQFKGLGECIIDPNWAKLPQLLYSKTSLESFHAWMVVWTILICVGIVFGLVMFCMISRNMERSTKKEPKYYD